MRITINFEPQCCPTCHQTTAYASRLNRGTVDIVQAIANFIAKKGLNAVHPMKEMLATASDGNAIERVRNGRLTPRQIGNLGHACIHGLIAALSEAGTFCLTSKGAAFLRGEAVPLVALVDKATHATAGYLKNPDGSIIMSTMTDMRRRGEENYWEGINYEIKEGNVMEYKKTITT